MEYDVIVIGGGLGGLTAGAKLAKSGKKTLLIEQNSTLGGCAATFKRKNYLMDVGLHEMDGLDKRDYKLKIFDELGLSGKIKFVRVPEFYRALGTNVDFVMPDNAVEAQRKLIEQFPNERSGIQKFFRVIVKMGEWMARMPLNPVKFILVFPLLFPFLYYHVFRYEKKNVGDFLDSIISDEKLKLILLANVGYYHDDPYELGMIYFGTAQASYFSGGGHFIKGGSKELTNALAGIIKECGGEVLTRHEAVRIITGNGQAKGVVYRKVSKTHQQKQMEITAAAKSVIANAPLPVVINEMIPDYGDEKFRNKINSMKLPNSAFSVYLGFRRPVKELGNSHYSTFVANKAIKTIKDISKDAREGDCSEKSFVFVDYSQIDSGLTEEGGGFGSILISDSLKNWEGLTREEYLAKKKSVAETLIDRVDKLIPGVKDNIEYYEAATPLTIKRFTRNPNGVFYGFAQTVDQEMMKRPTKIPGVSNLYIASAWGMPGGGFSGAIFSGYFAAMQALSGR